MFNPTPTDVEVAQTALPVGIDQRGTHPFIPFQPCGIIAPDLASLNSSNVGYTDIESYIEGMNHV
jgi:hypothetical protein